MCAEAEEACNLDLMIPTRRRYRHLFLIWTTPCGISNHNSRQALWESFGWFSLDRALFDDFLAVYNRHNDALWELYRRNGITKQELSRARFDRTMQELGIGGIEGLEFNRIYLMLMPLQTHLCEGAPEVLEKLSQKYQMHIITNGFSEVQFSKLERSGLNLFFKQIFVSEEIKSPKPSPEIFRYALKSCNARKKESLMIGDSWEVDVVGAMGAGIDQVYYNPENETNGYAGKKGAIPGSGGTLTYRIVRLKELLDIL